MTTVGEAAFDELCRKLERLPWPNPLMGKLEDDERKLIAAIDRWILTDPQGEAEDELRQANDPAEIEARFQVVMAAAAWSYWKRDPYLVTHPALAAATGTAETNVDSAQCEASQSGPAQQGNAQSPSQVLK